MRVFRIIPAAIVSMMFLFPSCGRNLLKETKIVNEKARYKLLIAGDSSEFKDSVRDEIVERYKDKCSIEIINIEKLEEVSKEDFDFVLIMEGIRGWGILNPVMRDFIDRIENRERIVLFATSMNPYYEYSYEGIDAVTSASQMEKKDEIVKKLTEKLDRLIK